MKNPSFSKLIKEVDLFGKEPDIYYKGKQRKTTMIGRIFTWIYISFYIFFFIYKLIRMFKRLDVSFSETNGSSGGLPLIHLNKEIFTYGLALSDDLGQPIFDETIYSPVAFLVGMKTINGIPNFFNHTINFERCDINDFGQNFKRFTTKMNLSNYYCLKNFDVDFEGYTAAENYTTLIINIKKCKGHTKNGVPCKSDTEIKNRLNRKNLIIFSEDFDLTPNDYEKPVKEKFTINSCPIRLDQFQTFVGYYQLVNIQTENNLFGFEAFSDIKSEKYLIYHSALIMSYEMMDNQQEVLTYNILLKENTLTNLRTYTQLIDVLGDVGGLMEVVESIFGVICALVADILYDKTMVNNLFSFDLNNFTLRIKNKQKINNSTKTSEIKTSHLSNEKIEINIDKKLMNFSKNTTLKSTDPKKQKFSSKKISNKDNSNSLFQFNSSNDRTNNSKILSSTRIFKKTILNNPKRNDENHKEPEFNFEDVKIYNYDSPIEDKIFERRKIINKIETNIFCTYFCFCFVRKRDNFGNALLDEAMNIITEKLDIYNMFRNFYFIDELKTNWNYEYKDFEMSDECKSKLKEVSKKIMDSFYRL